MPEWILPANRFTAKFPVYCFQGTAKRLMPDLLIKEELMKKISANIVSNIDIPIKTEVAPTIENNFIETVGTHLYVFTEDELQELINKIIKDERED